MVAPLKRNQEDELTQNSGNERLLLYFRLFIKVIFRYGLSIRKRLVFVAFADATKL